MCWPTRRWCSAGRRERERQGGRGREQTGGLGRGRETEGGGANVEHCQTVLQTRRNADHLAPIPSYFSAPHTPLPSHPLADLPTYAFPPFPTSLLP
eukprot:244017-Chlamydomonas_euryale.AAC.1